MKAYYEHKAPTGITKIGLYLTEEDIGLLKTSDTTMTAPDVNDLLDAIIEAAENEGWVWSVVETLNEDIS